MRPNRGVPLLVAAVVGVVVYFAGLRDARAVPSFARKYQTSCQTCHTVYPVLNPFGEAFRRDGYRFPSQNGSVDSDAVKAPMIALGQEEYEKTFPDSVWPDKIADAIPLSVMFNGTMSVNLPDSDAKDAAGKRFTWSGIEAELHLFGAGAFNDTLTYMTQLTLADDGHVRHRDRVPALERHRRAPPRVQPLDRPALRAAAHELRPPQRLPERHAHAGHLRRGALQPERQPARSVRGTPTASSSTASSATASGTPLGWVASSNAPGLTLPNAEDVYAHIGMKSGGVALDGEGKYGPNVPDPRKPWAEKAITLDLFAYHGMQRLDNGTGTRRRRGAPRCSRTTASTQPAPSSTRSSTRSPHGSASSSSGTNRPIKDRRRRP